MKEWPVQRFGTVIVDVAVTAAVTAAVAAPVVEVDAGNVVEANSGAVVEDDAGNFVGTVTGTMAGSVIMAIPGVVGSGLFTGGRRVFTNCLQETLEGQSHRPSASFQRRPGEQLVSLNCP